MLRRLVFEAHPAQALSRGFGGIGGAGQQQRQFDILQHGERGQQLKGLKDEADALAAQGGQFALREGAVARPSISTSPAVGKSIAPARFSSVLLPQPLRPEQRGDRAGFGGERNAVQDFHRLLSVGICFGYAAEFQPGYAATSSDPCTFGS